jgi:hypothetical protein
MAENQKWRGLSRRLPAGAGWGALAAAAMGVVMLAGKAAGVSPMPKPVPVALVAHTLGMSPGPALIVLAVVAHLAYGAAAGTILAGLVVRAAVWHGVVFAVVLWVAMGLVWLPYLGWGLFGTGLTPKIAVATLVLHLVYGLTLGVLLARRTRHHLAAPSWQEMAR